MIIIIVDIYTCEHSDLAKENTRHALGAGDTHTCTPSVYTTCTVSFQNFMFVFAA